MANFDGDKPVEYNGRRWFEVSVTCGTEFICHSPTLERAVEYMFTFDRLAMDLFWTLGWPSWAARGRLEPTNGEHQP